jgi:hypothetical protein
MRKVLIVGNLDFYMYKKLAEAYKDVLFIEESNIRHYGCNALIELVGMFDEVLIVGEPSERITYEVACAMKNVNVSGMSAYPMVEEKSTVEELSDTAKQIIVDTMRMPS